MLASQLFFINHLFANHRVIKHHQHCARLCNMLVMQFLCWSLRRLHVDRATISSQDTSVGELHTECIKWKHDWQIISIWFRTFDKCIPVSNSTSIVKSIIHHSSLTLWVPNGVTQHCSLLRIIIQLQSVISLFRINSIPIKCFQNTGTCNEMYRYSTCVNYSFLLKICILKIERENSSNRDYINDFSAISNMCNFFQTS